MLSEMAHPHSHTSSNKELTETVLLRHAVPKYNFQGRKLPKETPTPQPTKQGSSLTPQSVSPQDPKLALATPVTTKTSQNTRPSKGLDRKSAAVRPFSAVTRSDAVSGSNIVKPIAAVVAPNIRNAGSGKEQTGVGKTDEATASAAVRAMPSDREMGNGRKVSVTYLPCLPAACPGSVDIPVPDAALLAHAVEGPGVEEKLEMAEREIAMLRSQLDVQLKVNAEIKRLLVASVGEDFERKVENLARDRAQLALELGDFTKKMTEDYENLDQISIQADMWRSKYLASRVMVEELASARAFYSSQFQDSQQALQELLNERYELRTGLLHSYKILQQVKEAFDPLNTQKSHSLASTNALDLSKQIKQLSEAVRFRLLPAHAGSHVMMPLEESWESSMTKAELLAYDQLSKESAPPSFKHSMPSGPPLLTTSTSYERFHPMARHDNLTVNCCTKCKGEIKIA